MKKNNLLILLILTFLSTHGKTDLNVSANSIKGSTFKTVIARCSFNVTPDLPLISSSAQIELAINQAVAKFSDSYLGTTPPTLTQLNSAIASYNTLGIVVSGGGTIISGNTISNITNLSFLRVFARHLKFNPSDTSIATMANNAVWWTSQEVCDGHLDADVRGYDYRNFGRPAILLKNVLSPQVQEAFKYTLYLTTKQFNHYWVPVYDEAYQTINESIDTDQVYNKSDILLVYCQWQNTPEERYRYMRGFKRYMNRFFSYTSGTANGLKPDGTGFHHWTAYNNYMYSYNTAMEVVSYLDGTSFQVDQSNYKTFRDAVLTQLLLANDAGVQALSMSGRKPSSRTITISQTQIAKLAIAGGNILGLSTADPILAGIYNRKYSINPSFNYNQVAPFEEGYIQLNHASAGIFRHNNWVICNKGFTNGMWGTETYPTANRFGRYQSYGALEIVYPGNESTGNGYNSNTWDWNLNPGATVIRLPWSKLHAERARIDESQTYNFVGSLTFNKKELSYLTENYGTFGMFAMNFKEVENQGFSTVYSSNNHNGTFTFKKSNFFFDDLIVCLSSGISNNDVTNKTITPLYQRLNYTANKIYVNGVIQNTEGEIPYAGGTNTWILDNFLTGFYLVSGNDSFVITKNETQQTPNNNQIWPVDITSNPTDKYYSGYIDHGTNPNNKGYEYIIKPNSNTTEMGQLHSEINGGNKPYVVHQKNATAHIIEHIAKKVFGYGIFTSVNLSSINI
jgi:hypothetical protein